MSVTPFGNDSAKIEGYRAFWERRKTPRPLVGFSCKSWFPICEFAASSAWQPSTLLEPAMVDPKAFLDDQDRLLREGESIGDDILRGVSPSQGIPWLCGTMGGRLRVLPGSVLALDRNLPWGDLDDVRLDTESPWFRKYMEFLEVLIDWANGRLPVSHGSLIGPCDVAALLRGHSQSILDLIEEPERSRQLLRMCGDVFRDMTEAAWQVISQYHGGWFDAQYQLWAPGPIARLQEDASALYSPALYREFLQPVDRSIARHFSSCFMHLHPTSMFLLDAFLEIEELRCFQINREVSGPSLPDMVAYYQQVQAAQRSLVIRGSFTPDEIRLLMDHLDPAGLYLYIMVESLDEAETLKPLLGMNGS